MKKPRNNGLSSSLTEFDSWLFHPSEQDCRGIRRARRHQKAPACPHSTPCLRRVVGVSKSVNVGVKLAAGGVRRRVRKQAYYILEDGCRVQRVSCQGRFGRSWAAVRDSIATSEQTNHRRIRGACRRLHRRARRCTRGLVAEQHKRVCRCTREQLQPFHALSSPENNFSHLILIF